MTHRPYKLTALLCALTAWLTIGGPPLAAAVSVGDQTAATDTDTAGTQTHPRLIAAKLAQANKAHDAEKFARAYRLYHWLLDRASETDAGHTAAQRIAEYETDEERMATIRAAQAEQKAKALLTLADSYRAAGKDELAKETYEQVLTDHQDAPACCGQARAALAKMN